MHAQLYKIPYRVLLPYFLQQDMNKKTIYKIMRAVKKKKGQKLQSIVMVAPPGEREGMG